MAGSKRSWKLKWGARAAHRGRGSIVTAVKGWSGCKVVLEMVVVVSLIPV